MQPNHQVDVCPIMNVSWFDHVSLTNYNPDARCEKEQNGG